MVQRKRKHTKKIEVVFHQQNPPPGNLAACGRLTDERLSTKDFLIIDRDRVTCPDCLSRPDPTIIIR